MRHSRLLTSSLLLVTLAAQLARPGAATAYPGDVFQNGAPVMAPPAAADPSGRAAAGHRVSDSGAVEYTVPLPVSPNRQGMVPDLALQYSSRSPLRGGVAAGWTLPVPTIELDTTQGALRGKVFRSSLSRGVLIRVGAPDEAVIPGFLYTEEYRADEDDTYVKYERRFSSEGTDSWRAYTTDGRIYHFGTTSESRDLPSAASAPGARDGRFFVTRIVDRFGNEIELHYQKVLGTVAGGALTSQPVDIALTSIEYGKNAAAGLAHHSRLVFEYASSLDTCAGSHVPIGAQFDYRSGHPLYKGARRLDRVRLDVAEGGLWTERRALHLGYDTSELACDLNGKAHAPLRLLTAVAESAVAPGGAVTSQPQATFTYGRRERVFDQATSAPDLGSGQTPLSFDKAGGWPTIEAMLLDLDGNGILDPLHALLAPEPFGGPSPHPYYCQAMWRRSTASGHEPPALFGAMLPDPDLPGIGVPNALPVIPWASGGFNTGVPSRSYREGCSLAAQFSRETTVVPAYAQCGHPAAYLSYRFLDVDGDSLPDLVTAIDTNRGSYRPEDDLRVQPKPATCADDGACQDQSGDPTLCKVVSPLSGYLFQEEPGGGGGSGWCPQNSCWTPGCDYDATTCCSPLACTGADDVFGNNWAPPVDSDWPEDNPLSGTPDADLDRAYNGTFRPNGPVGGEGRDTGWGNGDSRCAQWPEMACGRYVLRVYKNLGGGQLSGAPELVLSPVPLETDRPTSRLGSGHLAASSSWHGFLDLDGDGVLDAVHMEPFFFGDGNDHGSAPDHFSVFPGDGTGQLAGAPAGGGYVWPAPRLRAGTLSGGGNLWARARVHLSHSSTIVPAGENLASSSEIVTIQDMNGDGLPDYVDTRHWAGATPAKALRVFYNTGRGFESNGAWPGYEGTVLDPSSTTPLQQLSRSVDWAHDRYRSDHNRRGYSRTTQRLVDVDADGLLDVVVLPDVGAADTNPWIDADDPGAQIYLNVGDRLVYAGSNPTWNKVWRALGRITLNGEGRWRVMTDFVDLDGDGLPEAITNEADAAHCEIEPLTGAWDGLCGWAHGGWTDAPSTGAMRLLTSVDNGRGGTVTFQYAPLQATAGRLPHPLWVATSMTAHAGQDATGAPIPAAHTSYAYEAPAYDKDFQGVWGFRGFGTTTVTGPSGASTVTTRDFTAYHGGRVVEERTVEAGGHVASIVKSTWQERTLFDGDVHPGTVRTQHRLTREARTCGAAQSASACETAGALRVDEHFWVPLTAPGSTTPLGHSDYQVRSGAGLGALQNSTYSAHSDELRATGTEYWIVRTADWSGYHDATGAPVLSSWTSHYYDTGKKVELWTSRYVAAGAPWATTTHIYDMATGNKIGERSPNHYGLNKGVFYTYDPTKRFVVQTTNELGHVTTTLTDPATGAVLEERGPNEKNGVLEGTLRTIDGFGRTLTESVMIDNPWGGYTPVQVLARAYSDVPLPRVKVITERRIELDDNRWVKEEAEVDGFGQPVTAATFDGTTLAARTSVFRDAAGNVVRMRAPRPDGNNPNDTVDWTFGFDSLGRTVGAAEPARPGCTEHAPGAATWCGQRIVHDGRVTTREDVTGTLTGAAAGTPGKTRTTTDALDRPVLVEERTSAGTWAPTVYAFDGEGRVREITNADGVKTALEHDLLGRRTSVARGGKTWSYEYDLNGNLTKIQPPVPSGADPLDYATVIAFDDLDREVSRTVGKATFTTNEVKTFGTGSALRTYDSGPNGIGRLAEVTWSHGATSYLYDSRGHATSVTRSFSILGGTFSDSRTETATYNALGQPSDITAGEGSSFEAVYGDRGLPRTLWWSGDTVKPVVQLDRTAAGSAYKRSRSAVLQSSTSFDDAGRRSSFWVGSSLPGKSGLSTRASETFFFTGNGEIYRMDTDLSADGVGSPHSADFAYDAQHQLVGATGPAGYTSAFSFSPGGRVLTASVAADPSASRVHARDVTYTYGADLPGADIDPDAPVALTSPDSTTWMGMDHDAAGNLVSRDVGSQSFDHVYDGANRQRAVVAPDGSYDLYWYDGDGARALVVTTGATGVVERVKWTCGNTEVWYDDAGDVEKTFATASLDGHAVRVADGTELTHLFHDPRGHLIAALADDGSLRGGFRYGPHGELLEEAGSDTDDLLRRYNGKEHDATSGLAYYGYRYYDERSLTWTQADPMYRFSPERGLFEPRRGNLYSFTLGNPVRLMDPDGRDPIDPDLARLLGINECKKDLTSRVCLNAERRIYSGPRHWFFGRPWQGPPPEKDGPPPEKDGPPSGPNRLNRPQPPRTDSSQDDGRLSVPDVDLDKKLAPPEVTQEELDRLNEEFADGLPPATPLKPMKPPKRKRPSRRKPKAPDEPGKPQEAVEPEQRPTPPAPPARLTDPLTDSEPLF